MLVENSNQIFHCKKCDYTAKRKGDFEKHLKSKKHNASKMLVKNSKFICKCGKSYTRFWFLPAQQGMCYKEKSDKQPDKSERVDGNVKGYYTEGCHYDQCEQQ